MVVAAALAAAGLTAFWLWMIGVAALKDLWKELGDSRKKKVGTAQRQRLLELTLAEPFGRLLERTGLYDSLAVPLGGYHMKLFVLNGLGWTIDRTKREAALSVGQGYAALTGGAWLTWLAQEPMLLPVGSAIAIVLGCRSFVEASRRLESRRKLMIMGLPELMGKLMLLVGAGETVQQAFIRCLSGKEASAHPLEREWRSAVASLRNGQSFGQAIERFNRCCAVQEVSVFSTVVLLNYRRGGEHFALALRELSYSLWEKRKAIARTSGEEASSKLVFPLVGILLVMMVLVASPAFMLMG